MFRSDILTQLPYLIAAFIPALTFHEWGHAFVADKLGDQTPRLMGRLTLNPLAHMDVLGTIAIIFIGVGWAKPVPIHPENFKSSWGAFFTAAAGPTMNFLLAVVFALLLRFGLENSMSPQNGEHLKAILTVSLILNLAFAFFNLLPIGPLDGSHLIERILPAHASKAYSEWNLRYGSMALFIIIIADSLLHTGILYRALMIPTRLVATFLLS